MLVRVPFTTSKAQFISTIRNFWYELPSKMPNDLRLGSTYQGNLKTAWRHSPMPSPLQENTPHSPPSRKIAPANAPKNAEAAANRRSVRKMLLEISQNSQENIVARVSCLINFRPKKRLWHRCFPANFAKFLRTPFLIEHLW